MRKIITIEGKQIAFQADGGTMRKYRRFFNRDFLTDLIKLENFIKTGKTEDVEMATVVENITWVLAKRANPNIPEVDEWLESFEDPMAIIKASKAVFSIITASQQPTVQPKKNQTKVKKKNRSQRRAS